MSTKSYRDLLAWQKAMDLVDEVCIAARSFPDYELFALNVQIRKAVMSIPCNIAEGHGRFSFRDFRHFLRQARGSCLELETQIIIAKRRGYFAAERADELLMQTERVGKIISGLIRYVTNRLLEATKNEERRTKNSIEHTQTSKPR